jgi:hypothetical protein
VTLGDPRCRVFVDPALAENAIRAGESCVAWCRETTEFRLWLIMSGVVLGV